MNTPAKIIADSSALEAVCKSQYHSDVFTNLPFSTTNVCVEEVNRNKSMASGTREEALGQVLDYIRSGDTTVFPTGIEYAPYVEHQGEESIVWTLENADTTNVMYIFLFDGPASDELKNIVAGGKIEVSTPGRPYELVWQGGFITEDECHKAIREIATEEGWKGEQLVDPLRHIEYDDVF
jgi:hypothetical protein